MTIEEWRAFFEDPKNTPALLELLKKKNDACYSMLCALFQKSFIKQGRKLTPYLQEADIEDVFQDAVIIFMKKLDKVKPEYRVIDYLFGIFKKTLKKRQQQQPGVFFPEDPNEFEVLVKDWDDTIYGSIDQEHYRVWCDQILKKVKDPCKTLMILRYIRNYSIEAIRIIMGYKTDNVVRNSLLQCQDRIFKMFNDKNTKP